MDILLIGSGQVAEELIDKLNKNGDRVYLLSGKRDNASTRKRVFERYNFLYEDDSVKDIFESVKPDVTIFLGAWDNNFNWQKARVEATRYTASLINILSAFSMVGKGRFIYMSSQEVYGESYSDNVLESWKRSPKGYKAMAIAQGEDICANYRSNQSIDIAVLRMDNIYCIPKKGQVENDPCFAMCLEALRSGRIFASDRNVFSMLFVRDAVELIYKVVATEELTKHLYNISSMEKIDGIQLAEMVKEAMGKGIEVVDDSVGEYHCVVLDGNLFKDEFGQKILTKYKSGVDQVVQYMKRHSESFIHAENAGGSTVGRFLHSAKVILKAIVPYIENIIVFAIVFFLSRAAFGSGYLEKLDLFLLYVLLFAVVHGQKQAVISGLLATIGYCIQQMLTRSGFEVLLDYNTYIWMVQLFTVGLVVGYIKDQLHDVKQESEDEIAYLENKLSDIMEINDSNVRMKENFETQIINQKDSLGKIYEITSTLESQAPEEILFSAAQMISKLMECDDVAVYNVANADYARLFSATSQKARSLGGSIKYTDMTEMYNEIKERRVYINRNMNENLPLMASAVYSNGEMKIIFMLWGITWQHMNLSEANRISIFGQLVQSAVVRANQYLEALHDRRYMAETGLLVEDAFIKLSAAFSKAHDQGLTECTILEIKGSEGNTAKAAAAIGKTIRNTDYMGVVNDRVYVLLSNTRREHADIVMERFRSAGYDSAVIKEAVS